MAGPQAGERTYAPLSQRGYSKNGRGDASRRRRRSGWRLTRCVFVGDARMVSEANLRALATAGGRYLVGQVLRAGRWATSSTDFHGTIRA